MPSAAAGSEKYYVVDLHGNYAPSEGNRTISTSHLSSSLQATTACRYQLIGH
jgi:hypothetical protein